MPHRTTCGSFRVVRRSKIYIKRKFKSQPLLGFLQDRQETEEKSQEWQFE
jgi:hypothetical protein